MIVVIVIVAFVSILDNLSYYFVGIVDKLIYCITVAV